MSRVFILALDGLEFTLVEKFRLKHLMQAEHGTIDLSNCYKLATPIIWASFISGLPSKEHGVETMQIWDNRILRWLARFKIKGVGKLLRSLGFKKRVPTQTDWKTETIFDLAQPSIAINIPSYGGTEYLLDVVREAIEDESKLPSVEEHIWNVFNKQKETTLSRITENWRLFMAHFDFTDQIGHLHRGDLTKMWETYAIAEDLSTEIKQQLPEGALFLIVADHGMKSVAGGYGDHSEYGFYSSNQKLNLQKPRVIDFYPLIKEMLSN